MDDPKAVLVGGTGRQQLGLQADQPTREQALALAREFESLLMLQMIRQMRQSLLDESEHEDGWGHETLTDTIDGELARALSTSGGLGLAAWFSENLGLGRGEGPDAMGRAAVVAAAPAVMPGPGSLEVPATHDTPAIEASAPGGAAATSRLDPARLGMVTSSFGLRSDPISGRPDMHRGVDIRAAYGRTVPSAADGEVTFAGERGGYGQLVTIRHSDGVETRYAHLSSIEVRVGQHVQSGEMIGRIGQSGRATGPHLHFEVLQQGRPVDPIRWAKASGQLKPQGAVVDLPFDWSPRPVAVNGVDHEN